MVDVWYTAGTPVSLNTRKEGHYQFKIVLIGDPSVGKSSFLRRYIKGDSRRNTLPRIDEDESETESCGVSRFQLDETQKTLTRPDKVIKLTIWDTAGEFTYKHFTVIKIQIWTFYAVLKNVHAHDVTRKPWNEKLTTFGKDRQLRKR